MHRTRFLAFTAMGTAVALGGTTQAQADELYLYNWSNYTPTEVIERFEETYGISVTLDTYDSNETLLGRMQAGAGGYDVILPSDYMVADMIDAGLVQPIDATDMENFANVMSPHDDPWYDPGRQYSAPYAWGSTGIAYDSSRIDEELDHSWRELFEPREALSGQIAMLDDEVEIWNAATNYLGFDNCTTDPEEAQQILDLLQAQYPHVALFGSEGTHDRMIAGEVIMHHMWNGAAHRAWRENPDIVFLYPEEGMDMWTDNMMVPADAPNPDNARKFINFMMEPKNAAAVSNFAGYMTAIRGADEYMTEDLRENPAVNTPEEFTDRLVAPRGCGAETRELRNQVWTRLRR